MMLGSPKYMSPEQVIGKRADHRSDIFSLGVILYEMLTGAAPFSGENVTALMYQIVNFAPPAPSTVNRAVPEMLDFIVAKMLAKPIDERYQDAREVARDLRECERSLGRARSADARWPGRPGGPRERRAARAGADARQGRGAGAVGEPHAPAWTTADAGAEAGAPPARGVSHSFDSLEATQRLAALTGIGHDPADRHAGDRRGAAPAARALAPARLAGRRRRNARRADRGRNHHAAVRDLRSFSRTTGVGAAHRAPTGASSTSWRGSSRRATCGSDAPTAACRPTRSSGFCRASSSSTATSPTSSCTPT